MVLGLTDISGILGPSGVDILVFLNIIETDQPSIQPTLTLPSVSCKPFLLSFTFLKHPRNQVAYVVSRCFRVVCLKLVNIAILIIAAKQYSHLTSTFSLRNC